jgi:hypothetical protein
MDANPSAATDDGPKPEVLPCARVSSVTKGWDGPPDTFALAFPDVKLVAGPKTRALEGPSKVTNSVEYFATPDDDPARQ